MHTNVKKGRVINKANREINRNKQVNYSESITKRTVPLDHKSGNNGMIYYSYEPIVDADAVAIALAALASAIYSGTYNGSTIPIPAFG